MKSPLREQPTQSSRVFVSHNLALSAVFCCFLLTVNNVIRATTSNNEAKATVRLEFPSYSETFTSNLVPAHELATSNAKLSNNKNNNNNKAETSQLMVHEREYVSPQVRVQIECQRDKTIIKVNFTQPFSGTLGSGKLDTTKCKLNGNGTKYYELLVQHNATQCDTQWDNANSSIINTLFIRFHPSLETGSDLAKNIMCRLTVGDLVVGRRPMTKATNGSQDKKQIAQPLLDPEVQATKANDGIESINEKKTQ